MKKYLFAIFQFCLVGFASAQEASPFPFSINHLALSVTDLDRSAAFYKNILKLDEITNKTKLEGIRWFKFSDDRELHLISFVKEPITINKAVHLAITTSNFDEFVSYLKSKKINYFDWPGEMNKINMRADGVKQIFFQDPDGYWIEVNSVSQK